MALSMTGYGRGVFTSEDYTITIDLKSINHRYLELYFKIPKNYNFLEDKIRREISGKISRGKVEISVIIEQFSSIEDQVELNQSFMRSYLKIIGELKENFGIEGEIDLKTIVALPELFEYHQPDIDQEKLFENVRQALDMALHSLIDNRKTEGKGLCRDVREKLATLENYRMTLLARAPKVVAAYQEKLAKRIGELTEGIEVDPSRLATEIAIFADKSDITEELVRIESHLGQFQQILEITEPIGRRMDFLIQELNREINTVGSKASDITIAQLVINFKAELEKIREQIQNIE
ncbi:MAG TPA: YicC family protein [Firmicutes bacterium]|nr:YicC family protein [Bacillota bacterium]